MAEKSKRRAKISPLETKRIIQRTSKNYVLFFEKINEVDKLLAKLRDIFQIKNIRNKREIRSDNGEIQSIIRSYFKSIYSTKLENIKEMDGFLNSYHLPKLNQNQVNYLNIPITSKEMETVIKISQL
ncbi:rCG29267 [Rattus norvegicus]|uniref:RCG29267 n=1 Tax=Rattus norvegicus TaxID=10116 RepID=A6K834_RAT|nr:rCG29267 [Rattus norvegicus]